MKKHYIFLAISLISIASLTYYLNDTTGHEFITKTEKEIDIMHQERDSVFVFADEVLDNVIEQKKVDSLKVSNLDNLVKNKQITIEQQIVELKELVRKSNELKEWAEKERDNAIKVERLAQKQKIESQKVMKETLIVLDSIRVENKNLIKENSKYLSEINKLKVDITTLEEIIEKIKSKYTIELDDDSNDDDDGKRKKKKKE